MHLRDPVNWCANQRDLRELQRCCLDDMHCHILELLSRPQPHSTQDYRELVLRSVGLHIYIQIRLRILSPYYYGVATISRLLKVIDLFCGISLFYRAVLQKRPLILRSLLIVATPYV